MTAPLSDTRLTFRAEILAALSAAGAFCGECGFEPGETGCADCVRVRDLYTDAVMPIVDRLLAELAELKKTPRERANDRVRALLDAGDHEGACAAAEAFEASEAYDAAHPRH